MTTLATSLGVTTNSGPGVDSHGLADNQTILDQFANVLSRIRVRDFVVLVWIEPNLVAATLEYGCSQSLLQA